jgi:hypothetical protein
MLRPAVFRGDRNSQGGVSAYRGGVQQAQTGIDWRQDLPRFATCGRLSVGAGERLPLKNGRARGDMGGENAAVHK